MNRNMAALGAVLLALGAGGAALSRDAAAGGAAAKQNDGGLSISPALIEHNAQAGTLATMTVANRSAAPLAVTVTPRPLTQNAAGKVSPNRSKTLAGVSVSQGNNRGSWKTTPTAGSGPRTTRSPTRTSPS